jgi:integrase
MEYFDPPVRMMSRERVLTDDELRRIYRAADDGSTFGKIVRLLILTGQRRSQIARLRPEFIDETNVLITWPAEEMKGHRRHSMPLAPMAADLLSARLETGYLFPARGKDTAFNGFSKAKIDFDKRITTAEPWVLHDLRRTFSTGVAKLRVPPHIKEMLLAHASAKNPVEAIYDRYSYADEMREALEKWERHLAVLLERE